MIVLKKLSHELAPLLTVMFQRSLDAGEVPADWREALVKGNITVHLTIVLSPKPVFHAKSWSMLL